MIVLSFVIPTYNSRLCIQACLDSIGSQKDPDVEICVVDNGSTDSTQDFISKNYPHVQLILNHENKGSAFSRNQGIRATRGEYIVFLDADAFLADGFLKVLRQALVDMEDRCAGLAAKILQVNTGKVFSCGLRITSLYRSCDVAKGKPDSGALKPCHVDGFNSCCAVLRRSALTQAAEKEMFFDDRFFFLFEDTELSLRLKKKGYSFLFDPRLVCMHWGGSAPIDLQKRRFYAFRNRIYMILKHERRRTRFFFRSFLYDLPRTIHFYLTNRYASEVRRDVMRWLQNEKNTDI